MTSTAIDTPYHQQDDTNLCGLAVAQMLLERITKSPPAQSALARGSNVSELGISTLDLADLLTGQAAPTRFGRFRASPFTDYDTAVRAVIDTILRTSFPVPVEVVRGAQHWVAITGAVIDGEAVPGGRYTHRGFFVRNPTPITAVIAAEAQFGRAAAVQKFPSPPLPHRAGDHCGTEFERGAKDIYVTAYAWRNHNWGQERQYTAITNDHQPTEDERASSSVCVAPDPGEPEPAPIRDGFDADRAVRSGIASHRLDRCGPFAAAVRNLTFERYDELHVRLTSEEIWYQVRYNAPSAVSGFIAAFITNDGQFLGLMSPAARTMIPFQDLADLQQLVLEEFSDKVSLFAAAPSAVPIQALRRYWEPCEQSTSPYYAFIEAVVNGKTVYIGHDRHKYDELRPARCSPEGREERTSLT